MSGKRQAGTQVTRENYRELEDEDEDVPDQPARASAEVLAKRKILKPKSRLAGRTIQQPQGGATSGFNFKPATTASSTEEAKPNPFAGFGAFGSGTSATSSLGSVTSDASDKPSFSFGAGPSSGFSLPKKPELETKEAPKANNNLSFFINNSSENTSQTSLVSTKSTDKPSKIKALNDNFYEKITEQRKTDPVSNFTPILRKYIDYYDRIENDYEIPDAENESQPQEEQKALPAPPATNAFNFGAAAKPSLNFAATVPFSSTTTSTSPSTFNFGAKSAEPPKQETEKEQPKPEVIDVDSDDSDDDIKVEGPTFTLDKPPTTTDSVFKFSKDTKPTNSQGSGPSFTFSASSKKVDSVFKLTAPKKAEEEKIVEEKKEVPKPSFGGFNSTNNFTWSPNKPIELSEPDKAPTSTFNFGAPKTEEKKEETTTKPAFSFNFGGSAPAAPADTETSKPAFSFGLGSTSDSATATASAPSFGFKPATSSSFQFSFNKSNNDSTTTTTDTHADGQDEDKVEEVEVEGNFKPVAQLGTKIEEKTGEEEEETLYTKKSKITLYNPETKAYDPKGLGELKVLKNNKTSKSRILVRAEGSNRVVLNVAIVAGFKYETTGKGNFVRIPAAGSASIDTYLAQVKTAEDGSNLLNALLEAQKTA